MGRIGNFFKRAGRGIKNVVKKTIKAAPKILGVGKKVIDNPLVKTAAATGSAFGIPPTPTIVP